jgi:hypothetical protein
MNMPRDVEFVDGLDAAHVCTAFTVLQIVIVDPSVKSRQQIQPIAAKIGSILNR